MESDETTCPECAEVIKSAAKVCKHCGYRLPTSDAVSVKHMASPASSNPATEPDVGIFDTTGIPENLGKWVAIALGIGLVAYLVWGGKKAEEAPFGNTIVSAEIIERREITPVAPLGTNEADKPLAANICKAAIAQLYQQSPSIMKVVSQKDGITRVSYRRPSDGKKWTNECGIRGNKIGWRSVNATPGSGTGKWHPNQYDETLTYRVDKDFIHIDVDYGGGSVVTQSYVLDENK